MFRFKVFFENARGMYGIVLFGSIGAGELENDLGTTGVFRDKLGYVVNIAV
jgi:hypothetical protein